MKILILLATIALSGLHAQDVMDEMTAGPSSNSSAELANETILRIAPSRKILLLTNQNSSFAQGDFISIIDKSQLVFRALVARALDANAGIKIVKIYDEEAWKLIKDNQNIQVLRGDDSLYKIAADKANKENEFGSLIDDEDDLFKDTNISADGLEIEENKKRIIKPDNLISFNLGALPVSSGESSMSFHMMGSYSYQFGDNIWGEVQIGLTTMGGFPGDDIDTQVYNYGGRLKYTINAPFYTLIQPYAGIQVLNPYSPGAGVDVSGEQKTSELAAVDNLRKVSPVFGVTILKRMVPGWFFRADLGTDLMTAGLCLEF